MTGLAAADLASSLQTAEEIVRLAGEILRRACDQPPEIEYKGRVNLVTQADRDSEEAIVAGLRSAFPAHAIVAEESGGQPGEGDLTWLIDPLDGTTNFAHGFPVFAVSVGLRDADHLLVGVVYDPLRDECFAAARGQGARLNGSPIHVSDIPRLGQSLLATGFPYDRQTAEDNNTAAFGMFIRRCQGIRRAGAAALDLAYVACGRLDGFWEMRLNPWDVAAGALIVREAGGRVTSYQGQEIDGPALDGANIVASNGQIHNEMIATLQEIYPITRG